MDQERNPECRRHDNEQDRRNHFDLLIESVPRNAARWI